MFILTNKLCAKNLKKQDIKYKLKASKNKNESLM